MRKCHFSFLKKMFNNDLEKNIQLRSIIRFLFLKNMKAQDIQKEIMSTFSSTFIAQSTIYKWINKFKDGEKSVEDSARESRPRIEGLVQKVKENLRNNEFISARELSNILSVYKKTISKVLREDLSMLKVNMRWVPHELSDDLKRKRVSIAQTMLNTLQNTRNQGNIYTGDEIWIYLRNPGTSMWVQKGFKPPSIVN